jgi:xylose isomerase
MRGILVGTALAFCFCTPEAQNCTISIKIDNVLCDTLAHSDSSRYLPILIQLKNFTVIESTFVEPCEKSCIVQKYIFDTVPTLSFLRKYDLYDVFEPSVKLDTTSITLAYHLRDPLIL